MAQVKVPIDLTLNELLAQLTPVVSCDSYFTTEEWADYLSISKERARALLHLASKMHRLLSTRDYRVSALTNQAYSTWVYQITAS